MIRGETVVGIEAAILDFICMPSGFIYSTLLLGVKILRKKHDRENTLLTRTDRKTMTQAFTYKHIFKPLFQFSSSVQHPG